MILRSISLVAMIFIISTIGLSQEDTDHPRTKIIERTVDENGNVISERIYYEYQEGSEDVFDMPGTFDLDGLGFGDLFEENSFFKRSENKPMLGVTLNFEDGVGKVVGVSKRSGADEVDIRKGDEVISVEGVAISSIEDIQEIIEKKKPGDKISVMIFRDGEEITKEVELGSGKTSRLFFDMPEGGPDFFGQMDLDSIFDDSFNFWGQFFGDNLDLRGSLRDRTDGNSFPRNQDLIPDRATLGVYIDDVGAGVLITEVLPDSVGERAELKVGDVITKVDDTPIEGYDDLLKIMELKNVGDEIIIELERDGRITIISTIL